MLPQQRYEGLDHLRGILALSVMVYHFSYWSDYNDSLPFVVQQPLHLIGLYAVSTFYCLSGAALFIVYHSRKVNRNFIGEFIVKRSFRILPLFWAATTTALAFTGFTALHDDTWRVLLSYSLLFSWLDPSAYYAPGAWSIGNEWAFYSLFPILLLAWKKTWSRVAILIASLAASSYYAFVVIDPSISVSAQWDAYIAPLNQVLLFAGGMSIGSILVKRPTPRLSLPILAGASLVFLAISYAFELQQCIHGGLRLTLIGVCLAWSYGAGIFPKRSETAGRLLDWVGSLSYSIYLLHPIVFRLVGKMLKEVFSLAPDFLLKAHLLNISILAISAIGTMIASHYSYAFLERPAMNLGRSLLMKPEQKATPRT